jgi:hypothetical protein
MNWKAKAERGDNIHKTNRRPWGNVGISRCWVDDKGAEERDGSERA